MDSAHGLLAGLTSLARRSPWVVISAALHVVVLAILSVAYVHDALRGPTEVAGALATAAPRIDKVQELPELPQVFDREDGPRIADSSVDPTPLADDTLLFDQRPPDNQLVSTAPIDPPPDGLSDLPPGVLSNTSIGVGEHGFRLARDPSTGTGPRGQGGTWKYRDRFQIGTSNRGSPYGDPTPAVIRAGLQWLKEHQDTDGRWDAAGFAKHCADGGVCDGPGNPLQDVGVTGLALLAFLGSGNTLRQGPFRDVVRRGVRWLTEQQGEDGLIGPASSHSHLYSHGIATLALCEAFGLSEYAPLKARVQRAVDFIQRARNPYKVWRYHARDGSNDTSVTGWMVMVLKSAEDFGLVVDKSALAAAALWLDEVTDPATGQAGYTRRGEGSSRTEAAVQRFPAVRTEAMTAVALLCRFFLGQDPRRVPVMSAAADTMLKKPPVWSETEGSIDMYYWYYASLAMFQIGGDPWKQWSRKMGDVAIKSQRVDAHARGSWNPLDPWGSEGGRVYSTAMMVLCLEAYYRYIRILR